MPYLLALFGLQTCAPVAPDAVQQRGKNQGRPTSDPAERQETRTVPPHLDHTTEYLTSRDRFRVFVSSVGPHVQILRAPAPMYTVNPVRNRRTPTAFKEHDVAWSKITDPTRDNHDLVASPDGGPHAMTGYGHAYGYSMPQKVNGQDANQLAIGCGEAGHRAGS